MNNPRQRAADAALEAGAAHHRAGRWADAASQYADALRLDPARTDAAALLGGVLLRLNRAEDAAALLTTTHTRDPSHPLAALNLGRALLSTNRPSEAEQAFAAALRARPDFAEARLGRCRALLAAGRPAEALPLAREIGDASLLAAALTAAGDSPGACLVLRAAIADRSTRPDAVVHLRADLAFTLVHCGFLALTAGDSAAVPLFTEALSHAEGRTRHHAALGLTDTLFRHPDAAVDEATLVTLLEIEGLDHQRLAATLARALSRRLDESPDALVTSALFAPWLRRTIVADLHLNRAIEALRVEWSTDLPDAVPLDAVEALALQGWWTEYASCAHSVGSKDERTYECAVLPFSPGEKVPDDSLRARAVAALRAPPTDRTGLPRLDRAVFHEPATERALVAALPRRTLPHDATSAKVAEVYEAHPYPRLVGVHRRVPLPFSEVVPVAVPGSAPRRVLVAGAGTGQHPVQLASALSDATVLAVDLSAASLARTARVAVEHGLTTLGLLQADLLALGDIGTFDWIDCVGVLHHLAIPERGGQALVERLRPGGLLRLGVYSERGRQDVVTARKRIAEHGWPTTNEGLDTARAHLLDLPGLTHSVDFWSQSGLRDLVFHPCEHRYTPCEFGSLLDRLGLEIVTMQHARAEPARLYRARWPDDEHQIDLEKWQALEADEPWIFAGMIHAWTRVA